MKTIVTNQSNEKLCSGSDLYSIVNDSNGVNTVTAEEFLKDDVGKGKKMIVLNKKFCTFCESNGSSSNLCFEK